MSAVASAVTVPSTNGKARTGNQARSVTGFDFINVQERSGTYKTYRQMRSDPTIALARAIATSPIRSSKITVGAAGDEPAPPGAVELIDAMLQRLWRWLTTNAIFALDYGWQSWEKIFAVDDGRIVLSGLKPLLPDMTEIIVDKQTGSPLALKNGDVELPIEYAFIFTNDPEAGDLYGRSRHENIRPVWCSNVNLRKRMDRYAKFASGAIPRVYYPPGEEVGPNGAMVDNAATAAALLRSLADANGIAVQNEPARWLNEMGTSGGSLLRAWEVDTFEAKQQHGGEFVEMCRYLDSLSFRGWLVPERVGTEGQHGTLAESEQQADIALQTTEQVLADLVEHVNWYIVDPVLGLNWGDAARGSVKVSAEPLSDSRRAIFKALVQQLAQPGVVEILADKVDIDAMLEQLGVPMVDPAMAEQRRQARGTPEDLEMLDDVVRQTVGAAGSIG